MPGYVLSANSNLSPIRLARKFGARWYKSQSPTTLTRLYDAVGKTFTGSVGSTAGSSGFDNESIYKDIRLCNVVDGVATAYLGDAGFNRKPTVGDVMVEIPRYYYKIEENGSYRDFLISDQLLEGFQCSPRHAPCDQYPAGLEKIFVSAYMLNSSYRSVSGNQSIREITRATARNGCDQRGIGYYQYDFATFWTIALLYLIEVADWNSQSKIGSVKRTDSAATLEHNNGATDNVAWHSGRVTTSATETTNCVKYRHMESLWGNIWQWCDGINFSNETSYFCLNPMHYADDTASNYIQMSYQKPTRNGYQKALGVDTTFNWAQICTDATGADETYISDYYSYSINWRTCLIGSIWYTSWDGGLFSLASDMVSTYLRLTISCRLIVLPELKDV